MGGTIINGKNVVGMAVGGKAVAGVAIGGKNIFSSQIEPGEYFGTPVGAIVMWSGAIETIPRGWLMCDGENGTPDLRDRFIVGTGDIYELGDFGGENFIEMNLPQHTHISLSPSEAYTTTHRHSTPVASNTTSETTKITGASASTTLIVPGAGAHEHTFSGVSSSGGERKAYDNRPLFYSLYFIMKTEEVS